VERDFAADFSRRRLPLAGRPPEGGNDAFVTAGLVSPTPYNQNTIDFSLNKGALPNIQVTLPGGLDYATGLKSGQLNDQSYWSTHYVGLNGFSVRDTVNGGRVDGSYKSEWGPLARIDFGVSYTGRRKRRTDVSNDFSNGSNQYGSLYNTVAGQPGPITFATLGGGILSTFNFPNYLQGAGGSFPHTAVLLNVPALLNGLRKLDGTPNYDKGGVYDFNLTLPRFNAVNSYDVNERTWTAYVEARLSGSRWSGNIGVRGVWTNTRASTAVDNILSVTVANTSNPTNSATVISSDPTSLVKNGNYFLPLPSANLNFTIIKNLQLRVAGARVLARPDLNQLAPTQTNNAINQQYVVTFNGNANLKPITAWQVDTSLEWYYRPKSLISAAFFSKWLKDDITTLQVNNVDIGAVGCFNGQPCAPLPFNVVQPVNGNQATLYGVELGLQ